MRHKHLSVIELFDIIEHGFPEPNIDDGPITEEEEHLDNCRYCQREIRKYAGIMHKCNEYEEQSMN